MLPLINLIQNVHQTCQPIVGQATPGDGVDNDCDGDTDEDDCTQTYFFYEDFVTYEEAQRRCEDNGQTLAMPTTLDEWQKLVATKGSHVTSDQIWFGLDDRLVEGDYVWNSGEKATWTLWSQSQPDNDIQHSGNVNGEDCVTWYSASAWVSWAQQDHWNDNNCDEQLSYVCQGTYVLLDRSLMIG